MLLFDLLRSVKHFLHFNFNFSKCSFCIVFYFFISKFSLLSSSFLLFSLLCYLFKLFSSKLQHTLCWSERFFLHFSVIFSKFLESFSLNWFIVLNDKISCVLSLLFSFRSFIIKLSLQKFSLFSLLLAMFFIFLFYAEF